jgi:protein required for attachment to host cells
MFKYQRKIMEHSRTWYVVTDGGRGRILQKQDTHDAFDTHREFVSADIHRHTHELGTERPGRTRDSAGMAHHAVQPREDLHRADKRNFVYEVARALNEANARDEFDRLILVAPAHALGDLNQALDAPTQRKVVAQLQKDLTNVPNADLAKHFINLSNA